MAAPAKPRLDSPVLSVFILLAAAKAVYSLWRIVTTSAPDFAYYYQAAEEATGTLTRPIHLLPPPSILLYAPLHVLPFGLVQGIWVMLSFVSLLLIVGLVARSEGITHPRALMLIGALSYLSFPTQFTLGMGQVNLIALLCVAVSVQLSAHSRYRIISGIVMALAWLLKPELVLVLPVIVLCKQWRVLMGAAGMLVASGILSVMVWGTTVYSVYIERLAPITRGFTDAGIYYNQSLMGLLTRAGVNAAWVSFAAALFVALIAWYSCRKKARPFGESMWRYMPALLLMEPIAWQHHFVLLIPTYITLWLSNLSRRTRGFLIASYFLVSWNFASSRFLDTMPLGWLIASHGAIGALIVWIIAL